MGYTVIRKDFTTGPQKCDLCSRPLASFKAYIMQDISTGEIIFAGPKCALKNLHKGQSLSGVPDLTTFTTTLNTRPGGTSKSTLHGNIGSENVVDQEKQRALEYLMLREEKLSKVLNCSYHVLAQLYQKYRNGGLSPDDINHINNIEAKAPEGLALSRLKEIYNALFWIDVAIPKIPKDKTTFLINVRESIIKHKNITDRQKEGINGWLDKIHGVVRLK